MKKLTTRELVLLGVFGAVWGASELSFGAAFHALKMPMTGATLTAIGVMIACVARAFVPRRGSTVFIGAIAALLKLLSIGSVVIGPMLGILAGAIIAEVVLTLFVRPGRVAFMVAGAAAVLWTLIHPFVTGLLLFGLNVVDVWTSVIAEGSRLLGVDAGRAIVVIVAFMVVVRLVIGGGAGWLAWSVVGLLKRRGHLREVVPVLLLALALAGCAGTGSAAVSSDPATMSEDLTVTDGSTTVTFSADDLSEIGEVEASFRNDKGEFTGIGVPLADVLARAGYDTAGLKSVKAVSSDGFVTAYRPGDIDEVVVAYADPSGARLTVDDLGPFRLVMPGGDGKQNPYLVVRLEVAVK